MLKDDEIIEKLNEKFKIIQKVSGYKYGEDTILLFKLFQNSLNKKNIKLLLLTIKNIKKLQSAYSNYFLDNDEFIKLLETIYSYQEEK